MKLFTYFLFVIGFTHVTCAQIPIDWDTYHHKHFSLNTGKIQVPFVPNGDIGQIDTFYTGFSSVSGKIRQGAWILKDLSTDSNLVGLVDYAGLRMAGVDAKQNKYEYNLVPDSWFKLYGGLIHELYAHLMPGIYEPIHRIDTMEFDRFNTYWKVARKDIEDHKSLWKQYNTGSFGWIPPQFIQGGILQWPANGNPITKDAYGDYFAYHAPFVNVDGDPKYIPQRGDYPKVPGKDNLLLLFNDVRNLMDTSIVNRIGLGGHVLAYTEAGGVDEEHTIFLQYTVKNHNTSLDTFFISNTLVRYLTSTNPVHLSEEHSSISAIIQVGSNNTYGLSISGISEPVVTYATGQKTQKDFNIVDRYVHFTRLDYTSFNNYVTNQMQGYTDRENGALLGSCDKRRAGGIELGTGGFPFPQGATLTFTLAISSIPLDNSKTCEEQIVDLETHLSYLQDNYKKRGKRVEPMASSNFLYPNPASDFLYFSHQAEPGQLWLRSLDGRVIQQWSIEETTQSIGLPKGLASGLYLLEFINTKGLVSTQKLLIQR